MAMMERLRMKTIGTSIMVVQDQTSYDKGIFRSTWNQSRKKEPSISLLIILLWKLCPKSALWQMDLTLGISCEPV